MKYVQGYIHHISFFFSAITETAVGPAESSYLVNMTRSNGDIYGPV